MKHKKLIGILAGITLGAAALFSSCNSKKEAEKPVPLVKTAEVLAENSSVNTDKSLDLEGKLTPANQFLRDFPEKMVSARNIEKYEVPGAKYCLTHIKQIHDNPSGFKLPTKKELYSGEVKFKENGKTLSPEESEAKMRKLYDSINDCQKSIYEIISTLNTGQEPLDVRLEGIMDSDDLDYLNRIMPLALKPGIKKLKESGYFDKDNQDSYEFILGAAFKLVKEGKIRVIPAESKKFIKDRYNDEGRENSLLDLIRGKSPIVYSIYGTKHDFRNNIDEWNKSHPDEKISLIEVNPKYIRYEEKK